jgi:hypothetical protein
MPRRMEPDQPANERSVDVVGRTYWYDERDSAAESNTHNGHFGLWRANRSAKPAVGAARQVTLPAAAPPKPAAGAAPQPDA